MCRAKVACAARWSPQAVCLSHACGHLLQVAADFSSHDGTIQLRSSGSTPQFDGFLLVYNDSQQQEQQQQQQQQQDPSQQQQEEEVPAAVNARQAQLLAGLQQGQSVALQSALPQQHFTKAPGRYSEGSLVKALEELGIGRPSTYASTLRTLQVRPAGAASSQQQQARSGPWISCWSSRHTWIADASPLLAAGACASS
jgi:DNA topoisomerase IA